MFKCVFGAALAVLLLCVPAWSHGGGVVVVPVFVPGEAGPSLPPAKTGDYSRIHTVAILSAIGETFTVHSESTDILFSRARLAAIPNGVWSN